MNDRVTLLLGDCLELMEGIPDGSVDMILADPPFGTTACKWDSIIPLEPMWKHLKRIIKSNGAIVLFAQTPFDKVLGVSDLANLRYEWIWEKPSATGFFNANKMPMKAHENILVFYKKLPTYNPIMTHGHARKTATRQDVRSECYGKAIKKVSYDSTIRYPRSVYNCSADKQKTGNLHPTQKPVTLMEYLIKTYTNKNETVLDFSMGSGTTGVACLNSDRYFIGIESEPKYFEIAQHRLIHGESCATS